ncbi:MAG: LysE family translocator [Paracoccaceae bacterium]|nr:LysE family translocator [Paracoccaceae bacterium]MDE3121005.1 LysE family translocator [Paracoccaceae bacterium]MDE3238057.1 LysE family translocator [Paracoccaceae bacterium]
MEFLPALFGLAGMHILMAMLPGPNTVIVSWYAATRSRFEALQAVLGVVVASLVWVTLALWGVGSFLLEVGWLYRIIRLAGAAYLVYVGLRLLRAGLVARDNGMADRPGQIGRNPFVAGMMTTLSNPKSAVFWTSAFLVAVPAHAPTWFYAAITGVIAVQSLLWYGLVALVFSTGAAKRIYQHITSSLDLLAGGVLVLLGLKLFDDIRS